MPIKGCVKRETGSLSARLMAPAAHAESKLLALGYLPRLDTVKSVVGGRIHRHCPCHAIRKA